MRVRALPPALVRLPPDPLKTPERVTSESMFTVSVLEPSTTFPDPDKSVIVVELVISLMSRVPEFATEDESSRVPLPDKARVPALIVVAPV